MAINVECEVKFGFKFDVEKDHFQRPALFVVVVVVVFTLTDRASTIPGTQ